MTIIRNDDGTLEVPVAPVRSHASDDVDGETSETVAPAATTQILHPGEGGYDEALASWDSQQHPDSGPAVSTATGRQEAMALVHAVAESEDHEVTAAVAGVEDPAGSADALRHVLAGGVHAVEDFASEVAEAEGGETLRPHEATKIIGEILSELD